MSDDERARLEAAGLVAPIVRGMDETTLRRRVHTYDRETGEPVREVTVRQLIGGLAKVTALEVEVVEGKRPKEVVCEHCKRTIKVPRSGPVPKLCSSSIGGCTRQMACAGGCGKRPDKSTLHSTWRSKGRDAMYFCIKCEPFDARSARCIAREARRTPEERREKALRAAAGMTIEQRKARGANTNAAMTHEQRKARSILGARRQTPEQRSEKTRKGHATRRAKAAAVLSSTEDGLPQKADPND